MLAYTRVATMPLSFSSSIGCTQQQQAGGQSQAGSWTADSATQTDRRTHTRLPAQLWTLAAVNRVDVFAGGCHADPCLPRSSPCKTHFNIRVAFGSDKTLLKPQIVSTDDSVVAANDRVAYTALDAIAGEVDW
jgi:hypothetical protein